jgi:ABC-type sugar transport system substrate-binding protein
MFRQLVARSADEEEDLGRGLRLGGIAAAALALLAPAVGVAGSSDAEPPYRAPPGYTGAEENQPVAYPTPARTGGRCRIGFQNPNRYEGFMHFVQKAAVKEAEKVLGCRVIGRGDRLSPERQAANMRALLAKNVGAIIVSPLDDAALRPALLEAKRRGVPVVAIDASYDTKPVPLIATQVWQARDMQAYELAKALATATPNAPTQLGLACLRAPVPAFTYLTDREAVWVREIARASIVGTANSPSGDPARGKETVRALLQAHGDMNAVLSCNDWTTQLTKAASTAERRDVRIVGIKTTSAGFLVPPQQEAVETDPIGVGVQAAQAAYSLITRQHLPLPAIVVRPPTTLSGASVEGGPVSWALGGPVSWIVQLNGIGGG